MNPGKLLSPRHSPSCGPLKQQQLGDQDERHPGPRRASEQKRAMAARIAASSFSSAPSSPRLERRGAPGSKREPTTEEVRPARTSSPRFLLVLKSRAAALFDRGCSKMGTSRSVAGRPHALFKTCCGGGLRLMGAHPYQGPAIAGHTSKKKQAEIRKAMSVRLAIIAAEGRGGVFFSSSSLTRGP